MHRVLQPLFSSLCPMSTKEKIDISWSTIQATWKVQNQQMWATLLCFKHEKVWSSLLFQLASPENHAVKSHKSYNLAELLFSTTPQMKFLQCSLASETSVPFSTVCGKIIPALNLELFIRAILIIKTIDIMAYMHYSPKDNKHLISMATTRSTRSPPEVKA